jgi:hypothetical protein
MIRHLLSFVRSPLGYVVNLLATLDAHVPGDRPVWYDSAFSAACEALCLRDGIQDDVMF